jgi:hypothetical protein
MPGVQEQRPAQKPGMAKMPGVQEQRPAQKPGMAKVPAAHQQPPYRPPEGVWPAASLRVSDRPLSLGWAQAAGPGGAGRPAWAWPCWRRQPQQGPDPTHLPPRTPELQARARPSDFGARRDGPVPKGSGSCPLSPWGLVPQAWRDALGHLHRLSEYRAQARLEPRGLAPCRRCRRSTPMRPPRRPEAPEMPAPRSHQAPPLAVAPWPRQQSGRRLGPAPP